MPVSPRYRLVRTIATGGMAQVFEAVALGEGGFTRRVAVKRVLPSHAHDDSMRRMFLDEARIASQLSHGGIVSVLDYGFVDGDEFIVMEYVDGVDARRATDLGLRTGRPIAPGVALHIIAEVAHSLRYVHERIDAAGHPLGIVHRDVSPQNVLLSWDGDVKLSDFGIALAAQRHERTQSGVIKGKLSYMAPEQALGQLVASSADLYALGATAASLLGAAPSARGADLAGAVLPGRTDVPDSLAGDTAELVMACMALPPEARPDAMAVAEKAGRLAARALARDGRSALRDWLAPMKGFALIPAIRSAFWCRRDLCPRMV
jgi:serine/threonine-protein kinase